MYKCEGTLEKYSCYEVKSSVYKVNQNNTWRASWQNSGKQKPSTCEYRHY